MRSSLRVHRAGELFGGGLELQRDADFGQQLSRVRPNQVHAKHLVVLLVRDDLHHLDPLRVHDEIEESPGSEGRRGDAGRPKPSDRVPPLSRDLHLGIAGINPAPGRRGA